VAYASTRGLVLGCWNDAFTTFAEGDVFPGYSWRELRNGARERKRHGVLCHSAIELQSTIGCAYDCTYCPYGAFVCARLDVEHVPLTARCRSCNAEFHVVGYAFSCKRCDSPEIEIVSGRELMIEDIDLEV